MSICHPTQDPQEPLIGIPTPRQIEESLVLHLGPGRELGGFLTTQEPISQKPTGQRAKGQQLDSPLPAQFRHRSLRTAIEERATDLVGDDLDTAREYELQVCGIEVGQTEVANQTCFLELLEMEKTLKASDPVEVRAELVERLRSQIQEGAYKPDSRKVAEKMIAEAATSLGEE